MTRFKYPVLIGDIGGTNARFHILPDRNSAAIEFAHVRTADHPTIEDAIIEGVLAATDLRPRTAMLAAAGPITSAGLNLTNCDWTIRPPTFLSRTGTSEIVLFNDFDAQALALPFLQDGDVTALGGDFRPTHNATKAVIGPGTGLGVGALVCTENQWVPVGGEGGHVDLGPRTERECKIWPHIEPWPGDEGRRISSESVLSGGGLVRLYRAICSLDGPEPAWREAADITRAATDRSDEAAIETLDIFCRSLGRAAGDLALTVLPTGGVYIGGGIGPAIESILRESDFRAAFEDKAPHSAILSNIPTFLITHPVPALVGLAAFARDPDGFGVSPAGRSWPSNPS